MDTPLTQNIRPGREPLSLREYEQAGGYQGLRKALTMDPMKVQEEVRKSGLRGRGGAGFPTGQKWGFVPMGKDATHPKYLCVNADEMEPGTFKDRVLLEGDPHQVIESAVTSAFAIQADAVFVFLRGEYVQAERRLRKAVAEAYERHYVGRNILGTPYGCEFWVHTSAGRYMCGEETGLLNALEGRRATPRAKPPYPQACGLWGRPTVINNVETLCNVHHIVLRGAEWFRKLGRTADGGTKLYGASGRLKRPGLWELPMGTTAREILQEHGGGMAEGYSLRGVLPGGASTPMILERDLDVKMDFSAPAEVGSRLGTGTMIVLDDKTCPVGLMLNLERFFALQSCGWCTPCREGLPWVVEILRALEEGRGTAADLDELQSHVDRMKPGHTFCALAPGAMEPLASTLRYFADDFRRHVDIKRCPWMNGAGDSP